MKNNVATSYLLLTLTVLFWSGNMVVGRHLSDSVPPFALAFWRWVIALALVMPFALPHWRAQWPALKAHWLPVTVLGLLSVGGYNTFVYLALQHTSATNATILNSFIPIATMAFAFVLFGKRLRPIEAAGAALSLCGVLTIIAKGSLATLLGLQLNVGDLWMIVAVLVWGGYTVGLQWRPKNVHPMVLMAAFTVVGLAAVAPFYLYELAAGGRIRLSLPVVANILYVGIFPGFLGYVFYNAAVAVVGPSRGALFIHLMPVFGTLLAIVFLGERPQWYHYAGIALVFAGIALTTRSRAS